MLGIKPRLGFSTRRIKKTAEGINKSTATASFTRSPRLLILQHNRAARNSPRKETLGQEAEKNGDLLQLPHRTSDFSRARGRRRRVPKTRCFSVCFSTSHNRAPQGLYRQHRPPPTSAFPTGASFSTGTGSVKEAIKAKPNPVGISGELINILAIN